LLRSKLHRWANLSEFNIPTSAFWHFSTFSLAPTYIIAKMKG
jgi:hypothetical protein